MTPESFVIILPLPNKILQPNVHTASFGGSIMKAKAIKKYRVLTKEAVEAERIETIPWKRVLVRSVFYYTVNRRRDTDNAIGSLKSVYDGIVDSGLVIDDTPNYMIREQPEFKIDRQYPRVQIELVRCA